MEVIDPVEDYLALLEEVFDFGMLRKFITRPDFSLTFDALHAVTGAYAGPILVDKLGAPASAVRCATHLLIWMTLAAEPFSPSNIHGPCHCPASCRWQHPRQICWKWYHTGDS